ncbi:related to Integral membrane protein [Pseudozyma flocculosa]|uniref:Related to Integral membrane protein n=1 Tax=Pseudozyma flocculosa TaxID=84751 RepID=A0A5C3FAF9_9BASI|nr:related to Integral membrane protein [Pseudozyma flocculosa]
MFPDTPFIQTMAVAGAVFWSVQLLPQIWLNYRRHHTTGLHQGMMLLWALAGLPLGIYNILSHQHVALQVQAQILTGLSLTTWSQVMHYSHGWSAKRCIWALGALGSLFGACEAAVVVGFKASAGGTSTGEAPHAFLVIMAVLSACGLALGVLRHYLDIWQQKTVRGISWGFVALDAAGDLASLLAVACVQPPDYLAVAIYATELTLWLGIMLAGVAFNVVRRQTRPSERHEAAEVVGAPRDVGEQPSPRPSLASDRSYSAFATVTATSSAHHPPVSNKTLLQRLRRLPSTGGERSEPVEIALQSL